jgi:hypothetical protein
MSAGRKSGTEAFRGIWKNIKARRVGTRSPIFDWDLQDGPDSMQPNISLATWTFSDITYRVRDYVTWELMESPQAGVTWGGVLHIRMGIRKCTRDIGSHGHRRARPRGAVAAAPHETSRSGRGVKLWRHNFSGAVETTSG